MRLGGSSAKRWLNCPGSVRASEGLDSTSEQAELGTRQHEIAEFILTKGGAWPDDTTPATKQYVSIINEYSALGFSVATEMELKDTVVPEMQGTADAIAETDEWLAIIDFKHGRVKVEDFTQLEFYAGLYIARYGYQGQAVELVYVQANAPGEAVTRVQTTKTKILNKLEVFRRAAKFILAGDTSRRSGAWCKYCKALPACELLRGEIVETVSDNFRDRENGLIEALALLHKVRAWVSDIENTALQVAQDSGLPGYKVVPTRPRRYWKQDTDSFLLDLGVPFERLPVPPAKAKHLMNKELFNQLTELKSGGVKLEEDTATKLLEDY